MQQMKRILGPVTLLLTIAIRTLSDCCPRCDNFDGPSKPGLIVSHATFDSASQTISASILNAGCANAGEFLVYIILEVDADAKDAVDELDENNNNYHAVHS